ncbi:hypothetical protein MROS_2182 [Melioribacter roseus P3M-2]|uniref:Methyltransferase type 11 domain-containing protein n=1 Tax=Melioribacter roseus (strain DSM 23840 / JCM 17771 / VKM B-2668 / P3M-2) TaxID=1191523 RepID=I6YY07_MELRP|nr:methyltransferase domain-containing protein [Melioribacter roseus]AFN75412.1 hypothetical protein MROS_2182 [Melioribacter roseus P3M-2]
MKYIDDIDMKITRENNLSRILTIDNIKEKTLLKNNPTSSIYKVRINDITLAYKVIKKNDNIDFRYTLKSYENYSNMKNTDGMVKVYDYRITEEGDKFEVLMEYLEGYNDVAEVEENKQLYTEKIYNIFNNILNQNIIPVDSGLANFLVKDQDVKMIDLDFLLKWEEVTFFNIIWFITRVDEIKSWSIDLGHKINDLFYNYMEKYFDTIPYNPLAEKYVEEGEKLLIEQRAGDAFKCFEEALKLKPNCSDAFNNLAVIYWDRNEIEISEKLLEFSLKIEPDNKVYLENYMEVLAHQKKHEKIINVINNTTKKKNIKNYDKVKQEELLLLQEEIDKYSYPSNYSYDIQSLQPKGSLKERVKYFVKYSPDLFEPCNKFLSVGSSLGYMLLFHAYRAKKCVGIEPDHKANDIVKRVAAFRNLKNVELFQGTFKDYPKNDHFDLIWMGNVFQYMYVDYGWQVAEELAKISCGKCIIEAPFEGEFLKKQAHLNSNWKNESLMNEYKFKRFEYEIKKYFDIKSVNPSGTDPVNRLIVVLERK